MKGKKILSAVLFLGLAALTFYVVFKNQDVGELLRAIRPSLMKNVCETNPSRMPPEALQ